MNEIIVKTPGKLFIAGEYAILEPNQDAVVIAVDRYMKAKIHSSQNNELSLPQIGFPQITWEYDSESGIRFHIDDPKLNFIQNAMKITLQYLEEKNIPIQPFSLHITSELDDSSGKKYGLGSSAAIVVIAISAILHFYKEENEHFDFTNEQVYKLSSIVHYLTQGNGSCADIAASVYGGWLEYSMFRPEWLIKEIELGKNWSEILNTKWPGLKINSITPPSLLVLAVGWTESEAKTSSLVNRVQQLKVKDPELYTQFLQQSQEATQSIVESFVNQNVDMAIESLALNRKALQRLGTFTGVPIETPQLKELIEIAEKYGSGKSSGAGGGDCGIAFLKDQGELRYLYNEWIEAGITPLEIHVSKDGTKRIK